MRAVTVCFLAAQSVAVLMWWLALWQRPSLRPLFNAPGAPDSALLAFALPDTAILCALGGIAAWGLAKRRAWAVTALAFHAGAALYATLYCLALWALGGSLLAAAFMSAYLLEGWLLWRLCKA